MKKENYFKKLLKLFFSAFYLSACAFGGGFVSMSLIRQTYCQKLKWVSDKTMLDFSALAQACPGSISANMLMLTGYKTAGLLGAFFCILGSLIPPFLVISILYYFYSAISGLAIIKRVMRGMQAGVLAVILSLAIDMIKGTIKGDLFSVVIIFVTFFVSIITSFFLEINTAVYLVVLSAFAGILFDLLKNKGKKVENDLS